MSAAEQKNPDPVAEAAARALDDARGDLHDAAARLETAVRHSDSLRSALTEPLIRAACADAVRAQMRKHRASVWSPPSSKSAKSGPAAAASDRGRVIALSRGTLMSFPLPGGVVLADAKAEHVAKAADFYEAQAGDMAHKARWLRLVGQHLQGKRRVSSCLSERRLRELQEAASHA